MAYYTNSKERGNPLMAAWHNLVMLQMIVSFASLCYGTLESLDDIVELGRDLAFTISSFYILFKMAFFVVYADEIDELIDDIEECYRWERKGPGWSEVRSTKRCHFLMFACFLVLWSTAIVAFMLVMISTPFWVESQLLPFHVAWPFNLHDPTRHPISHAIIFVTQSCTMLYLMTWLVFADHLSVSIFSELSSALRVLCIELRHLQAFCEGDEVLMGQEVDRLTKFHQRIIDITDRCNGTFNATLTMQMVVNFLLVSLSVFEAMASRHNPKVAAEYLLLMGLTLGHLSFWSKFGDMLSQESVEVAMAAYEAYDPTVGSKSIHRQLELMIQRAQTPLYVQGRPFPPFNLENYMAILKQCYGILTFLLETME